MPEIRAVFFDFMGTCLDWHSSIVAALPDSLPENVRSDFALQWRERYFDANAERASKGQPPSDFDSMLEQVLLTGSEPEDVKSLFDSATTERTVQAWHKQAAWPDVAPAIQQLKDRGYEVYVHGNGTTRLQLDICKSSGLSFDMLFSSELLDILKPDPKAYKKAMKLVGRTAEECVLVAAHAYDTRGAKNVGMKTVYMYRWTDDIEENQEAVKGENDAWLESMDGLVEVIDRL